MAKLYVIRWKSEIFAQSVVKADNEEEAKEKAKKDLDADFEVEEESIRYPNWEIDSVIEIEIEDVSDT